MNHRNLFTQACFIVFLLLQFNQYVGAEVTGPNFKITRTPAAFDRINNVFFSYVTITNLTTKSFQGPFNLIVTNPSIPVVGWQKTNTNEYTSKISESIPASGQQSIRINFSPVKKPLSFEFKLSFLESQYSIPNGEKFDSTHVGPSIAFTNGQSDVIFSADTRHMSKTPVYVASVEVDNAGNIIDGSNDIYLGDTGDNNDEQAGDRIYSLKKPVYKSHPGKAYFQVRAYFQAQVIYVQTLTNYYRTPSLDYVASDIHEVIFDRAPFYDAAHARGVSEDENGAKSVIDEMVFTVDENLDTEQAYQLAEQIASDYGAEIVGFSPQPSIFTLRYSPLPEGGYRQELHYDPRVRSVIPNYIATDFSNNDLEFIQSIKGNDPILNHIVQPYETMKFFEAWDWLETKAKDVGFNIGHVNLGIVDAVDSTNPQLNFVNSNNQLVNLVETLENSMGPVVGGFFHGTSAATLIGGISSSNSNTYFDSMHCQDPFNKEKDPAFSSAFYMVCQSNAKPWHVNGVLSGAQYNNQPLINYKIYSKEIDVKGLKNAFSAISKDIALISSKGVKIVNMSFGYNQSALDELFYSFKKIFEFRGDILFVAAAGNDNIDAKSIVPANIDIPNVITVASSDVKGHDRSVFSNYGSSADILAPGENLYLPTTQNHIGSVGYGILRGTSFSAPFVVGSASLISAIGPSTKSALTVGGPEKVKAIREALLDNASATLVDRPMGSENCAIDTSTGQCLKDNQGNDLYIGKVLDACTPLETAMHKNKINDIVSEGEILAVRGHKLAIGKYVSSASNKYHRDIYIYDIDTEQLSQPIVDPLLNQNLNRPSEFGAAVDLDDKHVLIGSPGANKAYLYDFNGIQEQVFDPNMLQGKVFNTDVNGGVNYEYINIMGDFGESVALDGGDVFISGENAKSGGQCPSGNYELNRYFIQFSATQAKGVWKHAKNCISTYGSTPTYDTFFGQSVSGSQIPVKHKIIQASGGFYHTDTRMKFSPSSLGSVILGEENYAVIDASKKLDLYSWSSNEIIASINNISDWGDLNYKQPYLSNNAGLFVKNGISYVRDLKDGHVRKSFAGNGGMLGDNFVAIPQFDVGTTQSNDRLMFLCN